MARATTSTTRPAYYARLRGGPDDGSLVQVASLPGGEPPDFFHAGPEDPGVYVLAGAPYDDGSLPYWFISSLPRAEEPVLPRESTWTLISAPAGGGAPKVWHQHGEGLEPVRLISAPASSEQVPSFVGRTYVCPECDDTTVISMPEA